MQAQSTHQDSWKVQRVWDHFLVQGWKTLFKVQLLILSKYESELLGMGFEQLVSFLIGLPHRFLVRECERLRKDFWNKKKEEEKEAAEGDDELQPEAAEAKDKEQNAEEKPEDKPEEDKQIVEQPQVRDNKDGSIVEFSVKNLSGEKLTETENTED